MVLDQIRDERAADALAVQVALVDLQVIEHRDVVGGVGVPVVGSVSFAGSVVTFAKLQELMTSRPVVFPGLPVVFGAALIGSVVLSVLLVREPTMWLGVVLGLLGLLVGLLLVLPVGGPTYRS